MSPVMDDERLEARLVAAVMAFECFDTVG